MNETLRLKIALLNERGMLLQSLLMPLSDSELIKLTPVPSPQIVYNLKNRALYFSMKFSGELN